MATLPEKELTQRLNILRFPLIVGVLFIHSHTTFSGNQDSFITYFIRNIISNELASVAVPLFFLMSGYLFFLKFNTLTKTIYMEKLKARTRTLFIPFLFWNIATLLLIALAQSLPVNKAFSAGTMSLIAGYNVFDYLINVFGIGKLPISFQFWFIRDLMLLVILTPIIDFANKRTPLPFLSILFACWMLDFWPIYTPSIAAVLFFSVGAFFGGYNKNLFCFDKYGIPIIAIYTPIIIIGALFAQESFTPYLHRSGIVFGIASVLFLTKLVMKSRHIKNTLLSLSGVSFFVFAAHEPLQTIIFKLAYKMLSPESWVLSLFLYFIVPIFSIIILVSIYRILLNFTPVVLNIVTGGRNNTVSIDKKCTIM